MSTRPIADDPPARSATPDRRFRHAYAEHRAAEGRGITNTAELFALPYPQTGAHATEWRVRARSYEAFMRRVIQPHAKPTRPLAVLDLGSGNGWLSHRLATTGASAVALDVRTDRIDGLGAGAPFASAAPDRLHRVAGSFGTLPFRPERFDIAVFNASIHYATDLEGVLREATRVVRSGGGIAILDSPFYRRAADGEAMVREKRRAGPERFGDLADTLLRVPFIEFLTVDGLRTASARLGLAWRRHRVRYPLWYEWRPIAARLRGRRAPSRFDVWEAMVP